MPQRLRCLGLPFGHGGYRGADDFRYVCAVVHREPYDCGAYRACHDQAEGVHVLELVDIRRREAQINHHEHHQQRYALHNPHIHCGNRAQNPIVRQAHERKHQAEHYAKGHREDGNVMECFEEFSDKWCSK